MMRYDIYSSLSVSSLIDLQLRLRTDATLRANDIINIENVKSEPVHCEHACYPVVHSGEEQEVNFQSDMIIERFLKSFPIFKNLCLDNILIAGGSVSSAILDGPNNGDIDLFIYGLSIEEMEKRITKLVMDLELKDVKSGSIVKTSYTTTIIFYVDLREYVIQIIHRYYETAGDVIHGFDNGACSVAILPNNGKLLGGSVITTSLGKFAYENMVNIWDYNKRGKAYETRLVKYTKRGFGIMLPNFNVHAIKDRHVELSTMSFRVLDVTGNMLTCMDIKSIGYYTDYTDSAKELNKEDISKLNSLRLLSKVDFSLTYYNHWNSKEELLSYLHDSLVIYPNKLTAQVVKKELLLYSKGMFNLEATKRYYDEDPKELFSLILTSEKPNDTAVELFATKYQTVLEKLEKYNKEKGYKRVWSIALKDGVLNGAFHPRPIELKKFYGDYYKE